MIDVHRQRWLMIVLAAVTLATATMALAAEPGESGAARDASAARVDTLALINGAAVTSADVDALIMQSHQSADMKRQTDADLRRLLDKAINDELLIQQAEAIGLDEDEAIRRELDDSRAGDAVGAYLRAEYSVADTVSTAAQREYFETYYWMILLRQLSVRTSDEAVALRAEITGGADMDSLARELSLDTRRYRGGLHNEKLWADVENEIRAAAAELSTGEVSAAFAYREAYSLVRVEKRSPVDWELLPEYEATIRAALLDDLRKAQWRSYVAELARRSPIREDAAVIARIAADSAVVFRGDFLLESTSSALSIDEDYRVEETALRRAVSHQAMLAGTAAFDTLLQRGIDTESEKLLLRHAATRSGFYDDSAVVRQYETERRTLLLQTYLNETIVPSIVFSRQEFQEYYDEHQDDFRGSPEIRLGTIILNDEATAQEVAKRLADGADFDFVRRQYGDAEHGSEAENQWAALSIFSEAIQAEVAGLEIGESSQAIAIRSGWLVFQLEGRRPGQIKELEEVEMQIRQVMFQRKFNEQMDHHFELLKERSEIVMFDEAIERYFSADL